MNIDAIVEAYKNKQITAEEANEALSAAGANFRFDPEKVGSGWTDAQMEAGFKPGEPADDVPEKPDLSRNESLSGMTVAQCTKGGVYDVTYNSIGYAEKAVKR